MQQEHDRFKLDAAFVTINGRPDHRVVIFNFNVPLGLVDDPATYEHILEQLRLNFPPGANGTITPLYFQITAVYTIIQRETNEERLWLGSFNPRARELSQVTVFRPLDRLTFVDYCIAQCNPDRVLNKLSAVAVNGQNSMWSFGALLSLIISVQSVVSVHHPIYLNYPQLHHNGAARRRAIKRVFRIYYD